MISAIVLAAGLSRRMGAANKMILPYMGKTIITATVEQIIASGITEIIVVTGFEPEKIKAALAGLPIQLVHNPYYEKGMTTSIQQGVAQAKGNGYMICLGDMIRITPGEYALLNTKFEEQYAVDPACILLPFYNGEKGNPVIFSGHYRQAISAHQDMEGCKGIVQDNKQHLCRIEMPTNHVLMDMDYPEDYQQLVGSAGN